MQHFANEGIARRINNNAINRLANKQPIKDKSRSGRLTSWTPDKTSKLKRSVNNRFGVSQRGLGKKFEVHHTTISRQLAKMSISYRKREKTPKYNPKQQQKADELSGTLANELYRSSCVVIMDDERYFTFSGHNMPANAGYYTNDKRKCPDDVRFAGKESFPPMILVWIDISARGKSEALIRPSKLEATNVWSNGCSLSSGSIKKISTTCSGPILRDLTTLEPRMIGWTNT